MHAAHPALIDKNLETPPPPLATITSSLDDLEAAVDDVAAAERPKELSAPPKQPIPRKKRVSLTFWKPVVAKEDPASPAGMQSTGAATPSTAPVGHQARVLFALLTGQTPPPHPGRLQHGPSSFGAGAAKLLLSTPTLSEATVSAGNVKAHQKHSHKPTKAAQHQQKAMKKLKEQLLKPNEARKIVCDLKRMELPESADDDSSAIDSTVVHHTTTRGFALPPLDEKPTSIPDSPATDGSAPAEPKKLQPYIILPTPSLPPTTPGGLGAIAGAKSGAFELLADASGALVRRSGSQEGFVAPFDAIGVFIYWWGFELTLPPPTLRTLAAIDNVQSTLFPFLQAVVIGGGVPELAPLIRYVSSWVQMEFGAIKSQNRGNGVVLAATWLLPVALVPRPWDFPLPSKALSA